MRWHDYLIMIVWEEKSDNSIPKLLIIFISLTLHLVAVKF